MGKVPYRRQTSVDIIPEERNHRPQSMAIECTTTCSRTDGNSRHRPYPESHSSETVQLRWPSHRGTNMATSVWPCYRSNSPETTRRHEAATWYSRLPRPWWK